LASWPLGLLASWPLGLLASWPLGLLASWPLGLLASWPLGLFTSLLLDFSTSRHLDFSTSTSQLLDFSTFRLLDFSRLLPFSYNIFASWVLMFRICFCPSTICKLYQILQLKAKNAKLFLTPFVVYNYTSKSRPVGLLNPKGNFVKGIVLFAWSPKFTLVLSFLRNLHA